MSWGAGNNRLFSAPQGLILVSVIGICTLSGDVHSAPACGTLQVDLVGAFHSWVVVRQRVLWSSLVMTLSQFSTVHYDVLSV